MGMSTGARRGGVCADINVTPFADLLRTQPGVQATRNP